MIKVSSLFSQILSHIPRNKFEEIVKKHGAEKGAKGFTSWTQLVALLFCQLARADSLREICATVFRVALENWFILGLIRLPINQPSLMPMSIDLQRCSKSCFGFFSKNSEHTNTLAEKCISSDSRISFSRLTLQPYPYV